MRKLATLILIFLSLNTFGQQVYLGIPLPEVVLYEQDIILLEEIHWRGSYKNFSDLGKNQVARLDSFLNKLDTFKVEIGVHNFYSSDEGMNQRISELTIKSICQILSEKNRNNKSIVFRGYGSSRPIFEDQEYYRRYYKKLNSRIEIKLLSLD